MHRTLLVVVDYFEGQTAAIVGRQIPHVLLALAYVLDADYLGTLLEHIEDRGWQ